MAPFSCLYIYGGTLFGLGLARGDYLVTVLGLFLLALGVIAETKLKDLA